MSNMKVTILITCIGGQFTIPIIEAFRKSKLVEAKLIGLDSNPNIAAANLVDEFIVIPNATDEPDAFLIKFKQLLYDKRPNFILPLSEAETLLLSKNFDDIIDLGAKLPFNCPTTTELLLDKFNLLSQLKQSGVEVGDFRSVGEKDDLSRVFELGYPHKKVVLKPRKNSGSRGVIIIDATKKEFKNLLPGRFCGTANYEHAVSELLKHETCLNHLLMPYYGPDTFDVDCVFNSQSKDTVVPRLREYQNPLSPVNQGCSIDSKRDRKIVDYVMQIKNALNLSGLCDFDIAKNKTGEIRLLDASCRLSGSAYASMLMGYPLTDLILASQLGIKMHEFKPRNYGKMRPFSSFFILEEKD